MQNIEFQVHFADLEAPTTFVLGLSSQIPIDALAFL